jgi:hypothetical protein
VKAWSETYQQAIEKVRWDIYFDNKREIFSFQAAEAEHEKYIADFDQQRAERAFLEIEKLVLKLEKDSRRSINKSKYVDIYTNNALLQTCLALSRIRKCFRTISILFI